MQIDIQDKYTPTVEEIKSMRRLTGLGMIECKELLIKFNGNLDECIRIMRANSDEPEYEGLTDERIDILQNGRVIFSCKNLEQVKKAGFDYLKLIDSKYTMRYVDCFGRYREMRLK